MVVWIDKERVFVEIALILPPGIGPRLTNDAMQEHDIGRVIIGANILAVVPDDGVRDIVETWGIIPILVFRLEADGGIVHDGTEINDGACVVLC